MSASLSFTPQWLLHDASLSASQELKADPKHDDEWCQWKGVKLAHDKRPFITSASCNKTRSLCRSCFLLVKPWKYVVLNFTMTEWCKFAVCFFFRYFFSTGDKQQNNFFLPCLMLGKTLKEKEEDANKRWKQWFPAGKNNGCVAKMAGDSEEKKMCQEVFKEKSTHGSLRRTFTLVPASNC